jgi:hypothetical protein
MAHQYTKERSAYSKETALYLLEFQVPCRMLTFAFVELHSELEAISHVTSLSDLGLFQTIEILY